MPNRVQVFVDEPEALLNAGMYDAGAVIQLQSSTTETGIYADESTAALVAGTKVYTIYDADGTSSTWYRTRYESSGGGITSDWSGVFQVATEDTGAYICNLADVKQRLGIAASDSTDDEWLQESIVAITDEVESLTGRRFRPDPLSGTKTVYLDYAGDGYTLWLPGGVRSVTYVGVATTDQPDAGTGTYTEITSGVYVDPPEHERSPGWPGTRITIGTSSGYRFYTGHRTVKIIGSFGWAAIPATVRAIAEMCVVSAYRGRSSGGASSFTIGTEGERTYARLLTAADMKTLVWYRDVVVI